jgi:hypothetical protein
MPLDFDKQSLSYSQKPKKKAEPAQETAEPSNLPDIPIDA